MCSVKRLYLRPLIATWFELIEKKGLPCLMFWPHDQHLQIPLRQGNNEGLWQI